jgi:hypothetical protein
MSAGKLPPYIIFKGKDTRGSRVWKEFETNEARTKFGYSEEAFYAVQPKAWMDEKRFFRLDGKGVEALHCSACSICPWIIYDHGRVKGALNV